MGARLLRRHWWIFWRVNPAGSLRPFHRDTDADAHAVVPAADIATTVGACFSDADADGNAAAATTAPVLSERVDDSPPEPIRREPSVRGPGVGGKPWHGERAPSKTIYKACLYEAFRRSKQPLEAYLL